jgi:hypothetical protein
LLLPVVGDASNGVDGLVIAGSGMGEPGVSPSPPESRTPKNM